MIYYFLHKKDWLYLNNCYYLLKMNYSTEYFITKAILFWHLVCTEERKEELKDENNESKTARRNPC